MANGRELKKYRQKIMTEILNDKQICELLLVETITTIDDAALQDKLTKNNVFKYEFMPNTQEGELNYITFDIKCISRNARDLYKNVKLTINIICHQKLMYHETGYLRSDLIDECIQDLFNDNTDFGVGRMECISDIPIHAGNTHYGRQIEFVVKDFNSSKCGGN